MKRSVHVCKHCLKQGSRVAMQLQKRVKGNRFHRPLDPHLPQTSNCSLRLDICRSPFGHKSIQIGVNWGEQKSPYQYNGNSQNNAKFENKMFSGRCSFPSKDIKLYKTHTQLKPPPYWISTQDQLSGFLQTTRKGKVIAYLPEKFIQFTGFQHLYRHKIKCKAKKLEVNDLTVRHIFKCDLWFSGHVIPKLSIQPHSWETRILKSHDFILILHNPI